MVDIVSGEVKDTISPKKKVGVFRKGVAGGVIGGKARAKTLSEEQRADIARTAAQARWKKRT